MSTTLVNALAMAVPIGILFSWTIVWYVRNPTVPSLLQALGADCLALVVLVAEGLHWLP